MVAPEGTGPLWFFSRDDRTWIPYAATASSRLETLHTQWIHGGGVGDEGGDMCFLEGEGEGGKAAGQRYLVSVAEGLQVNEAVGGALD